MTDLEKVKNLLIKLDLKYQASKDQLNVNGIIALFDFDKEYKEFNTINALDVLNNLKNKLAITEKALELACDYLVSNENEDDELYKLVQNIYDDDKYLATKINYFKTKAKEMLENEKRI